MPRIFIIEDNASLRTLLLRVFHQLGHDVLGFSDGQEFLDALSRPDFIYPDAILTDHMMPSISGLEMLQQLRRNPDLANTPVIVFSAVDDDALKKQFFQAGAADFIVKGSIGIKDLEHYLGKHFRDNSESVTKFNPAI
ncbi:MAG TPA: response regulator [Tepidisphaeraceae bacterium]|jgi:CheY-like chemotaxis protein|nr:response regulator [Tepidisphaeraceae bacterium]